MTHQEHWPPDRCRNAVAVVPLRLCYRSIVAAICRNDHAVVCLQVLGGSFTPKETTHLKASGGVGSEERSRLIGAEALKLRPILAFSSSGRAREVERQRTSLQILESLIDLERKVNAIPKLLPSLQPHQAAMRHFITTPNQKIIYHTHHATPSCAIPRAALPRPALPFPVLPCAALPRPALPFPVLPCAALPCPALSRFALPCPASLCAALQPNYFGDCIAAFLCY